VGVIVAAAEWALDQPVRSPLSKSSRTAELAGCSAGAVRAVPSGAAAAPMGVSRMQTMVKILMRR